MKKTILISLLFVWLTSVKGQISIMADSIVLSKSDVVPEHFITASRVAENLSLEIDKDLMTLRVFGTGHEHAIREKAYLLELLEVDATKEKWLFQGVDKDCIAYSVTINVPGKWIDFITLGKEPIASGKALTKIHYPVTGIKINKEAIDLHLKEKGNTKK